MKAIVHRRYGGPEALELEEVERPAVGPKDALVRVQAAAANPLDWHLLRGEPMLIRAMGYGLLAPKRRVRGADFAGTVEAVGADVNDLREGDAVFGSAAGSFAEYVCASAEKLAPKPAGFGFEEAAAVPVAGITALQGLRDQGGLQAGQRVLVVGASGGVGTFAVQIAKALGAYVTGVCSTRNVELVESLGADAVIDYTREDFTRGDMRYDVVLDLVGTCPLLEFRRVLAPRAKLVVIGAPGGRYLGGVARFAQAALLSPFVGQSFKAFVAEEKRSDLMVLAELLERGQVRPVIDRTYSLEQVPDALRYLEEGHARGKVVILTRPKD